VCDRRPASAGIPPWSAPGRWITPIHLIYKRVLLSELVEREGLNHPVIQAVRDGAVCMVNPFRCKLLHKKASLAVLSDEANAALFTPDEQRAIARHIPWTRTVAERHTTYQERQVDLLLFLSENKTSSCSNPTMSTAAKASCLAGKPTKASGTPPCIRPG